MKKIFVVAGGTAGHINAALSVGEYFQKFGHHVEYFSGKRYLDYKLFNEEETTFLDSFPLRSKNPFRIFINSFKNLKVLIKLYLNFKKYKPDIIIGAGGYVCGPTLLAAKLVGTPVFIIEQNAVMGLTNRILSVFADKIFVHFKKTLKLPKKYLSKVIVSGNPVRSSIKIDANTNEGKAQNVLVFGGSLGANQINKAIYELLSDGDLNELHIIHQVGKNNLTEQKIDPKIKYEQFEYIDDISQLYDWCDVIICRAGASTISELRIVGKPAVLVPFPNATDNHQYFNALELQNENLFPMLVIDYRKDTKSVAKEIKNFLKEVHKINMNKFEELEYIDPSEIIYKESEYVWNK